ncbi:unnamed protein product [Microthlaspi erraticum]|uniref:BTB domain-containing protein n=1 Tax=Microthlaspi erraticum TaxID=1685480 RepID=A0A6D2KN40_9BRAS|nr:unnamed protein product [Microthlaspi erraticum]
MKRWTNLGFVDTIYEEEDYVDHSSSFSSSSSSLSPSPQRQSNLSKSPSMELQSRVHKWSLANNSKPDVLLHVGDTRFHLHKDPLSRRSGYLKRHLTGVNELTLSPPLNITAETFTFVTAFCYGAHIQLTPFNVVPLRVAVEILLMTEAGGNENLRSLTESYLRRVVFVNADYIQIVLRSCLFLLPESETTAFLIGRSIDALTEVGDGDYVNEFLEEAVRLPAGDFVVVADAVQQRFPRHDLLYRVVDVYLKEHNGEITEEEKLQICNLIDCDKLSPPLLLHAVQNPKMPLRFIVRAMLQEQLNTRHSIMAAADAVASSAAPVAHRQRENAAARDSSVTLGSLLQRDTAARQNCRLRAAMDSTSSRIESLEKELDAMRKFISKECEKQKSDRIIESKSRSVMDSARSASFHCVQQQQSDVNKTQRGDRGSVSSLSTTFRRGGRASSPPMQVRREKSLGKRLIKGIKSAFTSTSKQQGGAKKNGLTVEEIYDGLEDFVWIKDDDENNISEELHSHYINNK